MDALRIIYDQASLRNGPLTAEDIDAIIADNEEVGLALHLTSAGDSLEMAEGIQLAGTKYGRVYPNGVAVLDLIGPIYPRANMMTSSGATSIAQFTNDFVSAYNNPDIVGIAMHIDSPGGDVRGITDSAAIIHALSRKGKKPVKSFASGYMASAAYYIGSTAQELVGTRMSLSGSIGVILTASKNAAGEIEVVSSQSPNKRPDPSTEDGMAQYKQRVDDMAKVFIDDVALFRGISAADVVEKYGRGGVMVGARAKSAGLIDRIGTLSSVVESIAKEAQSGSTRSVTKPKRASAELAEFLAFDSEDIETMGLKSLREKFAASNATLLEEDTAQSSASDESTGEQGAEQGQEEVIVSREELEEVHSAAAELFATQLTINHHIMPAQQSHAAALFLMAKADDELFGGAIAYIDKDGAVAEGTREDAIRAAFEAMPQHSLTRKAVAGIRKGDVVASVLGDEQKVATDEAKDNAPMSAERRAKLLGATTQGQSVLAAAK